jgi:Protein of unknown function (DUF3105)
MAQRTPTSPGSSNNRGAKSSPPRKAPAKKAGSSAPAKSGAAPAKSGAAPAKSGAGPAKAGAAARPGAGPVKRPPAKPGRSIVNQKTRPWGLIITAAVIVVLAIGVISYATLHKGAASTNGGYTNPEIADAKAIPGVIYKPEPNHTHVEGNITYDSSPPVGGNHSQYWADCSGTVYPNAIANENAVHMLEHGAVWITYKPGLPAAQVATLSKLVTGVDRMAMSPYPDLKTNISLQSWDYQLFVDSASDPRIQQFILALRFNPKTTPEATASCSQPSFIANPSTFGHPLWVPVDANASASVVPTGSSSAAASSSSSGSTAP